MSVGHCSAGVLATSWPFCLGAVSVNYCFAAVLMAIVSSVSYVGAVSVDDHNCARVLAVPDSSGRGSRWVGGGGGGDLTNIATHFGGDYCQCWSKSL